MTMIIDIVAIFVFVYILMYLNIIKTTGNHFNNVVHQKVIMFLAVTVFAAFLYLMNAMSKERPIKYKDVIYESLLIGLFAFIGQTILFDLYFMEETKPMITNVTENYVSFELLTASFVAVAVACGKLIVTDN